MDPELSKNVLGMSLRLLNRFLRQIEVTFEMQKLAFFVHFSTTLGRLGLDDVDTWSHKIGCRGHRNILRTFLGSSGFTLSLSKLFLVFHALL